MELSIGAGYTAKETTLASLFMIRYLLSLVGAYNCYYSLLYVLCCMLCTH